MAEVNSSAPSPAAVSPATPAAQGVVAPASLPTAGGMPAPPAVAEGGGLSSMPTLEQANQALAQTLQQNQQAGTATEVPPQQSFVQFIAQSDVVGKSLFGVLVVMSLVSWYIIVAKALAGVGMRRRAKRFLDRFWQAGSLDVVAQQLQVYGVRDPFSHLTHNAIQARDHHARFGVAKLEDAGTEAEFVTRTMRKVLDEETARLESGLTVLASIGSTAPFVGLFGTVWGVYHALVAIGMGGGATIDRIAGPVGEALIMTGLGLAVAIPAVLGFNTFVRRNRVLLSRLDAFAYDLFTVLTTGQRVAAQPGQRPASAGSTANLASARHAA